MCFVEIVRFIDFDEIMPSRLLLTPQKISISEIAEQKLSKDWRNGPRVFPFQNHIQ